MSRVTQPVLDAAASADAFLHLNNGKLFLVRKLQNNKETKILLELPVAQCWQPELHRQNGRLQSVQDTYLSRYSNRQLEG